MTAPFEASDPCDEVVAAYYEALAAGLRVAKSRTADAGGKYSYTYPTLEAVLNAIDDVLEQHDVHLSQVPTGSPDGVTWSLVTLLISKSGQWMKFPAYTRPQLKDEQGFGSALSYGRRYSLTSIFALIPADDDDGAAATEQQRNMKQYGGKRSPEELALTVILMQRPPEVRQSFGELFHAQFGCKLGDLPTRRHAEALLWTVDTLPTVELPAPEVPPEETSDGR